MNNQIYMIFYDRGYRAQDNAEYLCRWVMQNHKEVKTGYILNRDSYDWARLSKEGFNLINARDQVATRKELLVCDYACSSIFNETINLNFKGCHCKRIFLNHGCFLVPIGYLKNECNNIDLFIAANKAEYDTMLDPYHGLAKDQVALCGQPRQDSLVKAQLTPHEENTILIQFWQRPAAWTADNNKKFLDSDFYKKTTSLLSNKKLLDCCREAGLKITFKMHSIQYDWLKYYTKYKNDIVRISPLSELFEPEFIKSKLIVTDISSNAYEMAKIGKPCVYFVPDSDFLFDWRRKKNGGFEFDLTKHSIGPVIFDSVDKTVNTLCKMINNNFKLESLYVNRRREQISFLNNANNCERCFAAIMAVKRSRTAEQNTRTTADEKRAEHMAEVKKRMAHDYTSGQDKAFLYF